METIQLKDINMSAEMMDASRISSYVESKDYTAFEVYPTSRTLSAGIDKDPDTNITYSVDAPAQNAIGIQFKAFVDRGQSDVVIDWGDNTSTAVNSDSQDVYDYESGTDDRKVQVKHVYADSELDKKHIVKIYGCKYSTLRTYSSGYDSICSRIFDFDLPIAACVTDINNICAKSTRLLKVNVPRYFKWKNINNIGDIFANCKNLKQVNLDSNSDYYGHVFKRVYHVFMNCENLETSNWRLPQVEMDSSGYLHFYQNCKNMTSNIKDLLPENCNFIGNVIYISNCFNGCVKMTGSVSEFKDKLWFDTSKTWNASNAFKDCSETLRKDVPYEWCNNNDRLTHQFTGTEFVVKTTSAKQIFAVSLTSFKPTGTSFIIDWGDGTHSHTYSDVEINQSCSYEHMYLVEGEYTVRIDDAFSQMTISNDTYRNMLKEIHRYGDIVTTINYFASNAKSLTKICAWGKSITSALNVYINCSNITDFEEIKTNPMPSKITRHEDAVKNSSAGLMSLFTPDWGGTKS